MKVFISDPEIRLIPNMTKTASIVRPRSIEIHRVALATLDAQPLRTLIVRAENILDHFRSHAELQTARRTIPLGMWRKLMRTVARGFHTRTSLKRRTTRYN